MQITHSKTLTFTSRLLTSVTLLVGCVLSCNTFAKPTAKPRGTPVVWYVNGAQTTFGDGTTWNTAFNDLQDALDAASSGEEIWVAAWGATSGQED